MSIIGVDTSGKIGQLPLYIGVVKIRKRNTLDELRKGVSKKKTVFTMRRRIDAKYLNKQHIGFLKNHVEYSLTVLRTPEFSKLLSKFSFLKEPNFRILASSIYFTSKKLVEENDVLLIDKDYDPEKMKFLCSSVNFLYKKFNGMDIPVDIGTSYNESIALADIIASLGRSGKLRARRIKVSDLNEKMEMF